MLLASQSNFLCPPSIATKFMSKTFLFSNFSYVLFSPSLCFSLSLSRSLSHTYSEILTNHTTHVLFSLYISFFFMYALALSFALFLSFFFLLLSSLSNMHTHAHYLFLSLSLSLFICLRVPKSAAAANSLASKNEIHWSRGSLLMFGGVKEKL